jgi:hypothetical protein
MDSSNPPLHIRMLNERVRAMNQSGGKVLTLSAQEARSLHGEIYDLMATIAGLSKSADSSGTVTSISMDGGGFK